MTELPAGLRAALDRLQECSVRGLRPGRQDARSLLVELGQHLRDHPDAVDLDRIRPVLETLGEPWITSAREELALACSEYIRSVDPRFLGLENYDFEYTLTARERLEARLIASRELGIETPDLLLREVERTDVLLARALERAERPPPADGRSGSSK